ncbi:MAG: hypothetical protein ACLQGU_16300 [bacterium]
MRTPKFCLMILLCFEAAFAVACRGASLEIKDIQGTWTREKYITTVRLTRSPFSEQPETLTIKDNKLYWTSYHEGSWRKIIRIETDKNKGISRLVLGGWEVESPGRKMTVAPFKPQMNRVGKVEAIAFLDDAVVTNKQEPFVRLSMSLKQRIAELVLAGTYQDEKGQIYSFDKSGIAHWPTQSFSYEAALDSTEASCDYFLADIVRNPVNTKEYGFKWVAGKLELFNITDRDWGVTCEDRPFTILTPKVE